MFTTLVTGTLISLCKNYHVLVTLKKWLDTRLRKLRNEKKHEILSDGKIISGKGRLTDKIINKMQNYYGVAIRQNPGQLVTWNQKRYCSSVMALPRHTRSWR